LRNEEGRTRSERPEKHTVRLIDCIASRLPQRVFLVILRPVHN